MQYQWSSTLEPIYGEREARNMWRWYQEADRPEGAFKDDLKKLADHYPIQYLTGYAWFFGEKFHVNKNTLIPRPETEELVYKILKDNPSNDVISAIDLGTGTGCIPITLKKHRPDWEITGLELYNQTLEVARKNAQLHRVTIHWIRSNILDLQAKDLEPYDIIISNPPYIAPSEKPWLDRNVLDYEPHQALFTEDIDGLEFYRAIAFYGQLASSYGTQFYMEIHENKVQEIAALFQNNKHFSPPEIFRDMQGKDRILKTVRI